MFENSNFYVYSICFNILIWTYIPEIDFAFPVECYFVEGMCVDEMYFKLLNGKWKFDVVVCKYPNFSFQNRNLMLRICILIRQSKIHTKIDSNMYAIQTRKGQIFLNVMSFEMHNFFHIQIFNFKCSWENAIIAILQKYTKIFLYL